MHRFKLSIAYNGTSYAGWQIQSTCQNTIQGTIEKIIEEVAGERISVNASGRTDAGVHAEGQIAHLDIPKNLLIVNWQHLFNTRLPEDIRIFKIEETRPNFHARNDAKAKLYSYCLFMQPNCVPPRLYKQAWGTPPLNIAKMQEAAKILEGKHDFSSFQNSGSVVSSTEKTLFSITCKVHKCGSLTCPSDWPVISWNFYGDGFLKQMVRNIMSLLVWVGQEKIKVGEIEGILAAKDREALLCPTAPAAGLALMRVDY